MRKRQTHLLDADLEYLRLVRSGYGRADIADSRQAKMAKLGLIEMLGKRPMLTSAGAKALKALETLSHDDLGLGKGSGAEKAG